jgi:hypothetical protein
LRAARCNGGVTRRTGAVFAIAALVALGAAALSRSDAPRPIPLAAQPMHGTALAIVWRLEASNSPLGTLRVLNVRTLKPANNARLVLGRNLAGWNRSPDGSKLALLRDRAETGAPDYAFLRLVDLHAWKRAGQVDLGDGSPRTVAWLRADRIVVLQDTSAGFVVSVVDPGSHRVVSRRTVAERLLQVGRSASSLVLVTAPPASIGTAKLEVVDAQGAIRSTVLDQTLAGATPVDEEQPEIAKARVPALAVDAAGNTAYVLGANEPVASVDLASLTVGYHSLASPVSLLRRVDEWLQPSAEAKGESGPFRDATWLGDGLIAVGGTDESASMGSDNRLQMHVEPAGVKLVDTHDWSVRTIDGRASSFVRAGSDLLVTGATYDSSWAAPRAIGVVDYGSDGSQRFTVLRNQDAWVALVAGGRAFVEVANDLSRVVDLKTGKIVGQRLAPIPWLLVGDPLDSR